MWSLGFGLELIGVATLRRPLISTLVVLSLLIAALFQLPKVRFDGDITVVLPEHSQAAVDFETLKREFRDFSANWYVVVKSDRMFTAEGLEDLRNMQLDASLIDGINGITTLLSVPKVNPQTGEISSFFPEIIESDAQAKQLLDELVRTQPEYARLLSIKNNAVIMVVNAKPILKDNLEGVSKNYKRMYSELEAALPEGFTMRATGINSIAVTIASAMIDDQIHLTILGLTLGAVIAFLIFRSGWAALIVAFPAVATILFCLATFSLFSEPINFLSSLLPMLALILTFADGIVLYFKWERMNHHGGELIDNLFLAIRRIGPASALTSITTALAFLSFSISSNDSLQSFAYLGAISVALAFLSVIIILPLLLYWAVRFRRVRRRDRINRNISRVGTVFGYFIMGKSSTTALCGVLLVLVLAIVHFSIKAEYKVTDYLPRDSEAYKAEQEVNNWFGGRATLLALIPLADMENPVSEKNREKLGGVETVFKQVLNTDAVYSVKTVWDQLENKEAVERAFTFIQEQGEGVRSSYISEDASTFLMAARIPSDQSVNLTIEQINKIKSELEKSEYGQGVRLTGFPVFIALELPELVQQLRQSLIVAVFLGVIILGLATGSPLMAIAAITPNLLPILLVELLIYLDGGVINLAQVVGLTLGFGIAIDNAVHFLNIYLAERRAGRPRYDSAMFSVREVGPALGASTLIVCTATSIIQFSSLPMATVLGIIIILILVLALITNLILLPANILLLERFWARRVVRRRLNKKNSH